MTDKLTNLLNNLETIAKTRFSGSEIGEDYIRGNEDAHETCSRMIRAAIDRFNDR